MRIVFIGSGDIGIPSLEMLLGSARHQIVALVTQPDKPAGRNQELAGPPVKRIAARAGVPVLQPEKIGTAVADLHALRPDVFVVAAYGQLLPRKILELPGKACLNIHASLLPRHRGASPIQAAIREGDAETGVTIMWMDEGLDTGDILLSGRITIAPDETGGALHDRLGALAPGCLERALAMVEDNTAPRIPQDPARATLTRKLGREDGRILWQAGATEIERLVRACDPWPGTFAMVPIDEGKAAHLKVFRARVVEDASACPVGGTVIAADPRLLVSCGAGVIELLEVQLEGRRRLAAAEFLRGHPLEPGTRLS